MTPTADTPLQRATKAIYDRNPLEYGENVDGILVRARANITWKQACADAAEFPEGEATKYLQGCLDDARAALVAALQVRWGRRVADYDGCDDGYIGSVQIGTVYRSDENDTSSWWITIVERPFRSPPFARHKTSADAKSAVQRAVIEAILGVSL